MLYYPVKETVNSALEVYLVNQGADGEEYAFDKL